jgi:xanthine dehydrogenase accessory factor
MALSIGGSSVEALVIEEARNCLSEGRYKKVWHNLDDEKKDDTGMICGGQMEFFIEPVNVQPHLIIFGGGHVALPLARIASEVGFSYTIVEDREEFAVKDRFPSAKAIFKTRPAEIDQKINFLPTDFVAIVTRSHELDYDVLKKVLRKELKYVGLIASKVKKKQVFERLKKEGFSEKDINRIHSPIGLEIAAQTPEEIAISILAELIQVKNNPHV